MGIKHVLSEMGIDLGIVIKTDSSSAKGMLSRQGCGKVKHLEARPLWLQEKVLKKEIVIQKVPGSDNPSDALTHAWTRIEAARHFPAIGMEAYGDDSGLCRLTSRGGAEIPHEPVDLGRTV